jgi:hypothetical protein
MPDVKKATASALDEARKSRGQRPSAAWARSRTTTTASR